MDKIKPRTKPNYYFKKMLGRKDYDSTLGMGNVYDCNVDFVKPRNTALYNFAVVKGREESNRRLGRGDVHAYTHYDYNEYVWKSTSSVFPNTKKNLISF